MQGWKCPGCGACYAPFVSACECCRPKAIPATSTKPFTFPPAPARPLPLPGDNICRVGRGAMYSY